MADTYGVTPPDIARELPGLFPVGFTATSVPSDADVANLISTADVVASLRVTDDVGQIPLLADKAAILVKRYIIDWVKAQVIRIVYGGNDPVQIDTAAKAFEVSSASMLLAIDALGAQAEGTGEAAPRVLVPYTTPQRRLVVDDCDLDDRDLDRRGFSRGRF